MHKSKKAGIAFEELSMTLVVMLVAFIVIIVLLALNFLDQLKKTQQVEASLENLNANYNLDYFLRFQIQEDKSIAELISQAYTSRDYEQLKTITNQFFGDIYFIKNLGYDVTIGRSSINSINFAGKVAESITQIPLITKEALEIGLFVGTPSQPATI